MNRCLLVIYIGRIVIYALTRMMPWQSERRAAKGNSMHPPHTKLVVCLSEKAISRGK